MTFSSEEETKLRISEHQSKAGRIGGQSRSPEKRKAVAANLAKARAKRWPGREAANSTQLSAQLLAKIGGPNGNHQTQERTSEIRSGAQLEGRECGISLHQSDSIPNQQGDGGSNGERDKGVSGELFGFIFENGIPKGRGPA